VSSVAPKPIQCSKYTILILLFSQYSLCYCEQGDDDQHHHNSSYDVDHSNIPITNTINLPKCKCGVDSLNIAAGIISVVKIDIELTLQSSFTKIKS
jgi:hypothetical protein